MSKLALKNTLWFFIPIFLIIVWHDIVFIDFRHFNDVPKVLVERFIFGIIPISIIFFLCSCSLVYLSKNNTRAFTVTISNLLFIGFGIILSVIEAPFQQEGEFLTPAIYIIMTIFAFLIFFFRSFFIKIYDK
jgi:hypothetical protein